MRIVEPSVALEWITPDAEQTIERIARTCYKSEDRICEGSAAKLIESLIARGHGAMLEHASASFRVITDRGVTHEIVRHRLCSYAQESTRYCNYARDKFGGEIAVVQPPGLSAGAFVSWKGACLAAEQAYLQMLEDGVAPQLARSRVDDDPRAPAPEDGAPADAPGRARDLAPPSRVRPDDLRPDQLRGDGRGHDRRCGGGNAVRTNISIHPNLVVPDNAWDLLMWADQHSPDHRRVVEAVVERLKIILGGRTAVQALREYMLDDDARAPGRVADVMRDVMREARRT